MTKFLLGIQRHPGRFFLAIAFGYAGLWTCLEPIFSILDIKPTGYNYFYLLSYFIISIVIGIISVRPKKSIKFDLKNTNTKVEIEFGDLFQSEGNIIIPVNEYFDTELGKPVSMNSLHGKFIFNILGTHISAFDEAVETQLKNLEIEVVNRPLGKKKKFELGTTITIKHQNKLFFLFAMCNSDNDCKASCSLSLLMKALHGLWGKVRLESNGYTVSIPLIGNGLSGVGLPPTQLLEIILISLLYYAKEKDLSTTIKVVLLKDMFEKIDLSLIKNNWQ